MNDKKKINKQQRNIDVNISIYYFYPLAWTWRKLWRKKTNKINGKERKMQTYISHFTFNKRAQYVGLI